jgi:mannose-6-phosphate isomerase-like protein (cupin superfamily)
LLKIVNLERAILKTRKLAQDKIINQQNADEFVEVAEADGFKIYFTVGKDIGTPSREALRENPRDVFMLVFEGEIEFTFEKEEKATVKAGECFVLPKHLKHRCVFRKMTVALGGVYERGLQSNDRKRVGDLGERNLCYRRQVFQHV